MKEHEFKIRHDKATGKWLVWVKVRFLFFFTMWSPVAKVNNGFWYVLAFDSEQDCMKGIEQWKIEHAPDHERYTTL